MVELQKSRSLTMQYANSDFDEIEMDTQPAQEKRNLYLKVKYSSRWFVLRHEKKGASQDLNHAISVLGRLVDITPRTQPKRVFMVRHLLQLLDIRYESSPSNDDLNRSIELHEEANVAPPASDSERTTDMKHWLQLLYKRYEISRSAKDLNRCIVLSEETIAVIPASDPDIMPMLRRLLWSLDMRYEANRSIDDVSRSIEILESVIAATSVSDPEWISILNCLAHVLLQRFEATRARHDIDRLVQINGLKVAATPEDHVAQASRLTDQASVLGRRYELTLSAEDLNNAIDISNLARSKVPKDHAIRAHCELNHSLLLHRRFAQTGAMDTLDAAILSAEICANALSKKNPQRFFYRANLAKLLEVRFASRGSIQDLNRAIVLLDDAVDNAPQDDPYRLDNMTSLSTSLGQRFREISSNTDIDRAIELSRRVVAGTSNDDPLYAKRLANLANLAGPRYLQTGLIDDLNLAIDMLEKAVMLPSHMVTKAGEFPYAPVDVHHNEGAIWATLGHWLAERFGRTGVMADLNRSVLVSEQAIAKTPPGDKINFGHQSNFLSRHLRTLFEQTKEPSVITRAIEAARTAVENTPNDHSFRSAHLTNLANALFLKYLSDDGLEENIEEAIALGMTALDLTDTEQSHGAMALATLGSFYGQRFQKTKKAEYLEEALHYLNLAVSCENSPPADRADSARHAAMYYADHGKWDEACNVLRVVVDLLPHVSPRLLNNSDKEHQISPFSGLASFAAAMSLQAGNDALDALQLLEAGRGLIGASLVELRSDISELRKEEPEIAQRLDELRAQLDARGTGEDGQSNGLSFEKQTQGTLLSEADQELTNLIAGVRDLPGFERFLLPPSREDFLLAASRGPIVVINMNLYRCDALLTRKDRIWSIHLPNLKESDINEKLKETDRRKMLDSIRSADTLKWLWDVAVEPILIELGYLSPPSTDVWDQVWWVLTGPLSWFPIHAAGKHTDGKLESTLDRVMSSYSSSVKYLINGRSYSLPIEARPSSGHALLVAMQDTIGAKPLYYADREVEMLAALAPSLELKAVIPPKRRKDQILQSLRGCKVFHFAGHGKSNPKDPAQSLLLLDDWQDNPLTVEDLRNLNMHEHAPFLGFLSACSTSANQRAQLVDEGVHLAGSLQLAGFRHVIGTLWEVSDSFCVEVARTVYETIRDEGWTDVTVCRAVHKAVRKMREKCLEMYGKHRDLELCDDSDDSESESQAQPKPELGTYWIPYVHFGV